MDSEDCYIHAFPLEVLSTILALAVIVDLGAESGTGSQKRNTTELFLKGILFLWNFVRVLRQYQYSFMQWRRVRREKTINIIFSVCQNYNNRVVGEGLIGAYTKTCPEHERCATGFSSIFSHIVNVHWALNLKSCTL